MEASDYFFVHPVWRIMKVIYNFLFIYLFRRKTIYNCSEFEFHTFEIEMAMLVSAQNYESHL